jgi:catechol 2,3-dioxygenase-like lactoylglutathione lyase family enzyme
MAHVVDVPRSIAFYADLGFTVGNTFVPPGESVPAWAWLDSGAGASLMVTRASGPVDAGQQAVLFYLYVPDVAATHARLGSLGHTPGPISFPFYMPGGEFRLEDPDGYVLIVAQV